MADRLPNSCRQIGRARRRLRPSAPGVQAGPEPDAPRSRMTALLGAGARHPADRRLIAAA
jgi:hypothetical protein